MMTQYLQVLQFAVNLEILQITFPLSIDLFFGGFLMLIGTMILHVVNEILWGQNKATSLHKKVRKVFPVFYVVSFVVIIIGIAIGILPFVQ